MEIQGLNEIRKRFEDCPKEIKAICAATLKDTGQELLEKVQGRIGGRGRIAGVQEYRIGSGKGYVAVRAKAKTDLGGYAAGYITNALENGHSQTPGRYVPGIGKELRHGRVEGKQMYQAVRTQDLPAVVEQAAHQIADAAAEQLGGR